jgi:DNA-binding PadR family transcriptional regulator
MTDKELILLSFCFQWRKGRELKLMYEKETGKSLGYSSLYNSLRHLVESELLESRETRDEDGPVREFKITTKGSRQRRIEEERRREREKMPSLRGLVPPPA